MRIERLQINHLKNPVGFELDRPVFSWLLTDVNGTRAKASRIVVRQDEHILQDTSWANFSSLAAPLDRALKDLGNS